MPQVGQPLMFTAMATADESNTLLSVYLSAIGVACGSEPGSAQGATLVYSQTNGGGHPNPAGTFSLTPPATQTSRPEHAGHFLLCGYLSSTQTGLAVATASVPVTITGKRPLLCLVPKLKGLRLAAAERALENAHCAVGKVTKHKSSNVLKGKVISSSPRVGSKHKAGTRVALSISRGKQ